MYKNNKILKAATGAPLALAAIPEAGPLALFGGLAALGIYNATHPHASRTYMQDLQAQFEGELRDGFEAYKSKMAKHYQEKLANGEYVTPSGTHITSYNPNTMELSGYKIGDNGDIVYGTRNVYTKEFSPSVYYDANTGAYYEGITTPYINTVEVSRGENLMPWSIIPTTTPVGLTFDNTIMTAPLEGLYVAKKKKSKPNSGQTVVIEDDDVGAGTPNPQPNPDPKNPEDNWWEKLGKSFTDSFKQSFKKMGTGFTGGADATMKVVGYSLPPIITLGTAAGLTYGGYKAGEHFGFWGDENQPEPVKQEQSEPTYDNANLKKMIKQRDERQSKIDSLNNAR